MLLHQNSSKKIYTLQYIWRCFFGQNAMQPEYLSYWTGDLWGRRARKDLFSHSISAIWNYITLFC